MANCDLLRYPLLIHSANIIDHLLYARHCSRQRPNDSEPSRKIIASMQSLSFYNILEHDKCYGEKQGCKRLKTEGLGLMRRKRDVQCWTFCKVPLRYLRI